MGLAVALGEWSIEPMACSVVCSDSSRAGFAAAFASALRSPPTLSSAFPWPPALAWATHCGVAALALHVRSHAELGGGGRASHDAAVFSTL